MFSFAFVLWGENNAGIYKVALKRLGETMKTIEKESQFLSREETRKRLNTEILPRIVRSFSHGTECYMKLNNANLLSLRVEPRYPDPPKVQDHEVPVRIANIDELVGKDWGLTFLQIIPYIQGYLPVWAIAEESGVEILLVRRCLRQLLYYRCIAMTDTYSSYNRYTCTSRIRELYINPKLQKSCLQYITLEGQQPPPLNRVLKLYCSLRPHRDINQIFTFERTSSLGIDERKFIAFGMINRLIRRVRKIPLKDCPGQDHLVKEDANVPETHIRDNKEVNQSLNQPRYPYPDQKERITMMANGMNDYDIICAKTRCTYDTVDKAMTSDKNMRSVLR